MMKQLLFSVTLFVGLFHSTITLAQSPAQAPAAKAPAATAPTLPKPKAPAAATPASAPPPATPKLAPPPAPTQVVAPLPGPTDVTKILDKAGKFKILLRLLKSTEVGKRVNTWLNKTNQGLTMFVPTDNAFSNLQSGTLNSLNDQQQVQLMLFHVIPSFLPTSQFQTVSNPLRTEAGDTSKFQFPLNVTTSGNQVNVSTGVVNATVAETVYSDNKLAIYEVDKVLLPLNIFGPKPPASAPALAPALAKPKKETPAAFGPSSDDHADDTKTTSGAVSFTSRHGILVSIGVALIAAFSL